jgi:hypothetical protein
LPTLTPFRTPELLQRLPFSPLKRQLAPLSTLAKRPAGVNQAHALELPCELSSWQPHSA